jgi:hypothetical protein
VAQRHRAWFDQVRTDLDVLRDELTVKIEENEQLHVAMFELRRDVCAVPRSVALVQCACPTSCALLSVGVKRRGDGVCPCARACLVLGGSVLTT